MDAVADPHPGQLTGALGAAFFLLVNTLMMHKAGLGSIKDYPNDIGVPTADELEIQYDFIIVGAGTAGCVLANRLTQNPEWRVLLLEAGSYPSPSSDVPAFYPTLKRTSEDWNFVINESSKSCQGMLDNICKLPKGKVLGGTSTISNLHYTRANPKDFDDWFLLGNPKWGCEHSNFFYRRIEKYIGPDNYPLEFGKQGLLTLDIFNSSHFVKEMIFEAASQMDYPKLEEDRYIGYIETVGALKKGTRENMAKAFLSPVKNRTNLFFTKGCLVTQILVTNSRDKRAKGVECMIDNKLYQYKVKREVIVSAGAINTPVLLMLSGIGPRQVLTPLNIPVIMDLKVGKNLQIHFGVPIFVGIDRYKNVKSDQLYDFVDSTYFYVIRRKGPLTTTNINDLLGFLNTKGEPSDFPNVVVYHYLFTANDMNLSGFLDTIGYVPQIKQSLLKYNQNQTIILFLPTILKPKSRGTVIVTSRSPETRASINANFLTDEDEDDLNTLVSSFSYIMALTGKTAFESRRAILLNIDLPNCRNYQFCTQHYIKCYIQSMAYPLPDVAGTAKMGPMEEACSVVDQDLYVRGVRGLRIVDASIMPQIVSASIQATVAMIADRMSETIKEKWIDQYVPQPKKKCAQKCSEAEDKPPCQ